MTPNPAAIPEPLRARSQWVTWRYEHDSKVPYMATANRRASSTRPQTWASFDQACQAAARDGIGYVFTADDGLAGIDLDDCRAPDGSMAPWAQTIIDALHSYTEISPSGTGVKLWVRGALPGPSIKTEQIELYDQARYFCVTGNHLAGTPTTINDAQPALTALYHDLAQQRERAMPLAPRATVAARAERYTERALEGILHDLSAAREGTRNIDLNKYSFRLGQFVGRGLLAEDAATTVLIDAGQRLGLRTAEVRATVRSGLRAGITESHDLKLPNFTQPLTLERITERVTLPTESVRQPRALSKPLDVNDMLEMEYPPVIWYAPMFLREGLGLLVGQPNVGKTPAAVQLAIAIATGGKWLGAVPCEQAPVLYLGMEYSAQEIAPLIARSRCGVNIPRDMLYIKTIEDEFPTDAEDALAMLEYYIADLGCRVIIIDVLTAFLPPEKFKQNVYRGDYGELKPYHRLALQYNAAILGTWHASKREADPRLMYNGSTGLWAAAASRMTMYTDQDERVRIASFPRMADKVDWALAQDKTAHGHRWIVADVAPEPVMAPQELTIYRWLKANSDKANPKTPATVAEMTGLPPNVVRTVLGRMFDKNLAMRGIGNGYYVDVADVVDVARVMDVADVAPQSATRVAPVLRQDSALESHKPAAQQTQHDSTQHRAFVTQPVTSPIMPPTESLDGANQRHALLARRYIATGSLDEARDHIKAITDESLQRAVWHELQETNHG